MKKIIVIGLIVLLIVGFVFAVTQNIVSEKTCGSTGCVFKKDIADYECKVIGVKD